MPRTRYWHGVTSCLGVATVAALWLAALALWTPCRDNAPAWAAAIGLGTAALVSALWIAAVLVHALRRDIQRLRGSLLLAGADGTGFLDHAERLVTNRELMALAGTLESVLASQEYQRRLVEQRLTTILAALPTGVVVVTATGLVSLVNAAARHLFPPEALSPGTSVFAAITRDSLPESGGSSRSRNPVMVHSVDGRAIPARIASLGDQGGWVMVLEGMAPDVTRLQLDHDLTLHDSLPPASPPDRSTPLALLATMVVDCETTGLDPSRDRVVSIGAVRTHGTRVFAHANLDMLINPGMAIPRKSTVIHGIDDAMVSGAPDIESGLALLMDLGSDCVIVGHNIGFDLGILAAESARSGTDWPVVLSLDTGHLAAVLEPQQRSLDLDTICEHFGVAVGGRHTALGDALSAAELFTRMIPLLQDRGVMTLGDALVLARRARRTRAEQRSLGWHVPEN